jgi:phage terminase large subunit-like protein
VLYLTTQSDDRPAGVFKKQLDYFRKVRDGTIVDPTSLPVLYEYPAAMAEAQAWRDRDTWRIPNPSLGRSVDERELARLFLKAEADGKDSLRLFAAKHLNVEIGVGLKTDNWAGAEQWEAAAEPGVCSDLPNLLARSEVATIGIDGGGLDDLLALSVIGRESGTGRWLTWSRAWAHEIVLERRKSEAPRLLDLVDAGEIELVDLIGQVIAVADTCEQVRDSGILAEKHGIGVDPLGIGQISTELAARDMTADNGIVIGISQGYRLSGAIQTAERKLADGSMVHAGQALMAWAVGNARVELKGNALLITKQASGRAKIDPLVAMLNAVALMSLSPPARRSVYETRGLRMI